MACSWSTRRTAASRCSPDAPYRYLAEQGAVRCAPDHPQAHARRGPAGAGRGPHARHRGPEGAARHDARDHPLPSGRRRAARLAGAGDGGVAALDRHAESRSGDPARRWWPVSSACGIAPAPPASCRSCASCCCSSTVCPASARGAAEAAGRAQPVQALAEAAPVWLPSDPVRCERRPAPRAATGAARAWWRCRRWSRRAAVSSSTRRSPASGWRQRRACAADRPAAGLEQDVAEAGVQAAAWRSAGSELGGGGHGDRCRGSRLAVVAQPREHLACAPAPGMRQSSSSRSNGSLAGPVQCRQCRPSQASACGAQRIAAPRTESGSWPGRRRPPVPACEAAVRCHALRGALE